MKPIRTAALTAAAAFALALSCGAIAQEGAAGDQNGLDDRLRNIDPTQGLRVIAVTDAISYVPGINVSSNSFLIETSEGGVVVDTSRSPASFEHKRLVEDAAAGPIAYVILTHGHGDHNGGAGLWKADGAEVIAHESYPEFLDYQSRLAAFFALRNAAQFNFAASNPNIDASPEAIAAARDTAPTILAADGYAFTLGETEFQVLHTPGETPDHVSVWVPEHRAVFTGDNYYGSFPNLYTLRGTRPRWALDYVNSIDRVLALEPEILLPSHGEPIIGAEEIRRALTQYRDAIAYVHDETVAGMNQGKDVLTLMREVSLPEELELPEGYGMVSWSVRGIYESYVGWFDGDPASMYADDPTPAAEAWVELAGGPAMVAGAVQDMIANGDPVNALRLATTALAAAPSDEALLRAQISALETLRAESGNRNEQGWLDYGIRQAEAALP